MLCAQLDSCETMGGWPAEFLLVALSANAHRPGGHPVDSATESGLTDLAERVTLSNGLQ